MRIFCLKVFSHNDYNCFGKCGAVLAAEQYIREMGGTDSDIEAFENSFTERYAYLTCAELRGKATGQCNDYVGLAASIAGRMGLA